MREKRDFARLASKNRSSSGTAALPEFDIACIRCTPHPIVRVKRIKYFLAAGGPKEFQCNDAARIHGFRSRIKINRTPIDGTIVRPRACIHPRSSAYTRALHTVRNYPLQSIGSIPGLHTRIWRGFQMTVGKAGFSRFTPDFRACCGEM